DFLAVRVRIQGDMKRILPRMHAKTGAGPRRRRPTSGFVVAGPGTLPGAELAHVAGGDEHHRGGTGVGRLVKIVVRSFAVMNGGGLDRARIPRPPDQEVLRGPADLMAGVQIVILEVH